MTRYARRTDANQPAIIEALREAGCVVLNLNSTVDLLVGYHGKWTPLEIKNPDGKDRLQRVQKALQAICLDHGLDYPIVRTVKEALEAVGVSS